MIYSCERCGSPLREGHAFCRSCGAPVAQKKPAAKTDTVSSSPACERCGSPLREGHAFCHICGAPVAQKKPAAKMDTVSSSPACERCGSPLREGHAFCHICGAPVAQKKPAAKTDTVSSSPACQQCGSPLREGHAFCQKCGAPVERMKQTAKANAGLRCPSCGAYSTAGGTFCLQCGSPLANSGGQAVKQPRQRTAHHTPIYLSATALFLAVVLMLGLWRPGFLWALKQSSNGYSSMNGSVISGTDSELEGLLADQAVYNPTEIPVSGTPAFSESLADGITVSAAENALDTERTFTAEPLTESEMGELFLERSAGDWAPVYAFEFDAGLEDTERLPGEVTIDLDLVEFGVDEALWPYLSVMRFGDDGTVMELPTTVTDNGISCVTRQNCILAVSIGLVIGIPVMALIERGQVGLNELYPDGIFYEAVSSELNDENAYAEYRVLYPKSMARTDSAELKALENRMLALIEQYGLNPDIPLVDAIKEASEDLEPEAVYRLMHKIYSDPECLSIQATFNDPQWQQNNLWPESVANVVKCLASADDYLFGERGFKVPSHVIDVLVLDRWPHGAEMLGVTKNLYTSSPYIHFNASKTSNLQDLLLTTTHELFHVVQSGYVYFDNGNYTPFWEATAVLLENEAFDYYVTNQMIDSGQTALLTIRNKWELYDKALMTPSLWRNVSDKMTYMQNQGYVASYWLEFLKLRYYNSDDFLKQLMERFGASDGAVDLDVHKVLRDQTSSNDEVYLSDFRLFCIQNFSKFNERSAYADPKPETITLSADDPHVTLKISYEALSTRIRDIIIENTDDIGEVLPYTILAIGKTLDGNTPAVRFYQTGTFVEQLIGSSTIMLPECIDSRMVVHEIEDYYGVTTDVTYVTGYTYELYLMLQPEAPLVEIDDEDDVMRVKPQGFSLSDDISAGYDVVVITPEGDDIRFPQEAGTDEVEIPLAELESDNENASTDEDKYTVYIIEKVEFPDGSMHYGPDGKKFEQDDELRFEDILGTYDMTQSISGFESGVINDALEQMEGVEGMEDYLDQYNQYMGSLDGDYTGTMVISRYQTGAQIADISFYYPEYEEATATYRGTWDNGVLHIEPVMDYLSDNWDLTFKKENGIVTCEGMMGSDSDIASYSTIITAVKRD